MNKKSRRQFAQKLITFCVLLSVLLSSFKTSGILIVHAQEAGTETPTSTPEPTELPTETPTYVHEPLEMPTETPTYASEPVDTPIETPVFTPTIQLTPTGEELPKLDLSAAGSGASFRAQVLLKQPSDLGRLQSWGITVLDSNDDSAYVLVDPIQLAKLARLGFEPSGIDSLEYLVSAYNATQPGDRISKADLTASPPFLMQLSSVDSDSDGLTDTEEFWWCTDPTNPNSDFSGPPSPTDPNDGTEVHAILKGIRAYGPPFKMWPRFSPYYPDGTCPDGDFDGVPDNAELYMIGTNPMRESSDLDKFDDGQELFGVTFCPGQNGTCGYGILPRAEDAAFVSANLPAWVKSPGDSPFVAAFPDPEVEVVPSSLKMTQVTVITNTKGTTEGTEKTYGTSSTKGTSTSIANTIILE